MTFKPYALPIILIYLVGCFGSFFIGKHTTQMENKPRYIIITTSEGGPSKAFFQVECVPPCEFPEDVEMFNVVNGIK